jgi:TldD protein
MRLLSTPFALGERSGLEEGAEMSEDRGMSRRKVIGLGAATLASTALGELVAGPANAVASTGGTPTPGIGYFSRFGVDERMIRETIGEALSRGGDYADLFFQHKVDNNYVLEDGSVNRAFTSVELGVFASRIPTQLTSSRIT